MANTSSTDTNLPSAPLPGVDDVDIDIEAAVAVAVPGPHAEQVGENDVETEDQVEMILFIRETTTTGSLLTFTSPSCLSHPEIMATFMI